MSNGQSAELKPGGLKPGGLNRARGIDRAIDLLDCLNAAREPLRIGELAKRLGAPRSTVYELVNRFLEAGILETYDGEGRVFFGKTVHFYATHYLGMNAQSRRGGEEVVRLAELANETAQYCALHGDKYTVVHMHSGAKMFRISTDIGVRVPIPWTASGRLLLSHLSFEEVCRFIPAADFDLPDGRRIDPIGFYDEIVRARREGYCLTSGLVDGFTRCMAVPVTDPSGGVVATLCFVVTADIAQADQTRLLDMLLDSGRRLSSYQMAGLTAGLRLAGE
ncbi:MAG TPA: IclR family transcriptional regulator [Stellaceae bacterium]|nr:IclR family transcriptional regulator [Stellaceae bacterium]